MAGLNVPGPLGQAEQKGIAEGSAFGFFVAVAIVVLIYMWKAKR